MRYHEKLLQLNCKYFAMLLNQGRINVSLGILNFMTVCEISSSLWYKFMRSHCKNNFNDVLFHKHWKVLAFVISFSLTGAKTWESMGLLSSWCEGLPLD